MNRRIHTGIDTFIKKIADAMHERRTVLLVLSCVVVFMTTYLLILPAFTLEKDEAAKQGGIDVPMATEENVETDSGADAEEAEAYNNDEAAEETQKVTKQDGKEAPKKNASAKGEADDSESGTSTADNLLYEGDNVKISIDDSQSVLPADASIKVEEIDKEKKEYAKQYKKLYEDALAAVQEEKDGKKVADFSFAKFYDISILDGKNTVEPDSAVDVKIEFDKELQKELKAENTDRVRIVHFTEDKETGEITSEVLDKKDVVEVNTDKKDKLTDTTFKAEGFSVYAVVYTVDFHWEVNGKMYDFSMPGGGFVSFHKLVEVLGIVPDTNSAKNEPENAEITDADSADGEQAEVALTLNDVEASDATREFVADVEKVEFSSPDLVWVGKADENTTVGELKEANALEVQYSAELTEDQIAEINAQTVEAGDWALISMLPFASEETLTVTMKTGEVFTIRVTDAQIKKTVIDAKGDTYEITVTYDDRAEIPDEAELKVKEILPEDEKYDEYYQQSLEKVGVIDTATEEEPEIIVDAVTDALGGLKELISVDDTDEKEEEEQAVTPASDYARIFDIQIWSDNQEIQPKSAVTVNIKLLDAPEDEIAVPSVIHFAKDGAELMDLTEKAENSEDNGLQFVTNEFSVYSVVYTVDFFFEVNGKVYGFNMDGADSVSLRALVEALHVYEAKLDGEEEAESPAKATDEDAESYVESEVNNDELDDSTEIQSELLDLFMREVETVTFSNEELLVPAKVDENTTVGKIKTALKLFPTYPLGLKQSEVLALNEKEYSAGDWVLISMKPFDTQETLTITLKNGDSFKILVTDAQDAQMVGDQVLTVSNPAGTTIDLFDYWIISQDLVGRDGWGDLDQGKGGGDFSDGSLNGTGNNKGINENHALKFSPAWESTVFNGTKDGGTSNNRNGRNGLNSYTGDADPFQGIVEGTLSNGYPVLTNNETIGSDGESLSYLFDPSVSHAGKASYPSVDQLLYVDKEGYYTYDSRDYRADYSGGTFTLTEQVSDNSEIRGFWPFGTQNFWTGMHINTQFSMPANGQVLNPRGVYKDMQFEFSGDDDTWLYIDGVLVGDAGGIHNRSEIDVNFAKGTVAVTGKKGGSHSGDFEETKYLDDLFKAAGKYNESDWEDIGDGSGHKRFKAGTYHTFDMFYLERGGGESNLYIHYNLVSTADFTAHKSYEGYDKDDVLQRNQFRFELIGLDGKYRSVWSDSANDYVLVQEDTTSKAIMPHASSSGAGTTVSPYYNGSTVTELSDGSSVGSQTYITGNVEDGNVNFGTAEISEQDMHDCDYGNPPVYRYVVREVVPDDAVNSDNVTWAEATPAQRAAGGFVKDSIIYDGTVYYMSARVTKWTETNASGQEVTRYGLSKTYYTDDTYTEKKTDTSFIDFRNRYTPDIANYEFDKVNANREPVEGAVFQLFRDSACKIPAKDSNDNTITATSDGNGKVSFTNVRTGIYFLKEISVPEPYEVNDTVYRVKISKQGSSMSVNSDQDNNPVTEVINIKPDDITVIKKWYDAEGKEVSGEGYPATVQLRRYHYVRTGATPETHSVTLHFHFPDAGWNQPNVDFGPYTITGNSVVITWTVGGCDFYWDSDYSQKITDSSGANLLQIPLDQDLVLDIYGERDWASSNLSTVSVDGAFDDSKELRQDESFPSEMEVEKATQTLTSSSYMHAWSLGTGEEYDFPVGDELGDYLYYVVELDENGNAIEIGDEAVNGMTLKSIEYNPAKTDGLGITHGVITVKNELPRPQSINVVIKKTDDAENSTNYLAGAVFKLVYRENSDGTYANVSNTAVPELDTNSQFTVPTAGITLTGLVDGQYQLQEISPPSGYVITNNYPVTFTVSGGAITSTDGSITGVRYIAASQTTNAEFIIPNTPGAALPNTGGPGTRLFTILGSILILGAGVLLWRRRRLI